MNRLINPISLNRQKSHAFKIVDIASHKTIGHAELRGSGERTYKIDKLLIGDHTNRGKGIGQKVMDKLLEQAFTKMNDESVELNVFDWNTSAISVMRRPVLFSIRIKLPCLMSEIKSGQLSICRSKKRTG